MYGRLSSPLYMPRVLQALILVVVATQVHELCALGSDRHNMAEGLKLPHGVVRSNVKADSNVSDTASMSQCADSDIVVDELGPDDSVSRAGSRTSRHSQSSLASIRAKTAAKRASLAAKVQLLEMKQALVFRQHQIDTERLRLGMEIEKLQLEAELEAAQIESEVYEAAEQNKQFRVGDVQFEYTPGTSWGPVENGSRPCPHVQTPESEEIQTPKLRLADILNGCFSGPESRSRVSKC